MEQLNRIELTGIVGNVKLMDISSCKCARLTLVTNYAYKSTDGMAVIESTWHNISAFSSKQISCLEKLQKGSKLHVVGRLVNQRCVGEDGIERSYCEIRANRMELIEDREPLQCEFA